MTLCDDWPMEEGENKGWRTLGVCYRCSEGTVRAWASVVAVEEEGVGSEK